MKTFRPTFQRKFVWLFVSLALFASAALAQNIKLTLDATDAPKNLWRVRQTFPAPASAGNFALFYPKWIPGEHSPRGTLNNMVNLFITADGKPVEWRRDDVEMFAFLMTIPEGARQIEVAFDYVGEYGDLATANLARIKWNRLILYPRGARSDDVQVSASMKMPPDWKFATALPVEKETKNAVDFKTVNLTTFVDSPAIIGRYFSKIPLTSDGVLTEMALAGETEAALKYKPETLAGWRNLVLQGNRMFGARHYNAYYFLTTLSDYGAFEGLEHHESSENGVGTDALSDGDELLELNELLGHEYVHSWNGKYRRPDKLTTPDFEQPMHGELLWVYEGLTQYLGKVLSARSGMWTEEMFREAMAEVSAEMDFRSGRRWRPLVDTSRAVQFTYPSSRAWMTQRRRVDYYDEGALVWMDADVTIREKSGGKLSLDDFLRKFHGGANTGAMVKTYDLEEIVRTLNEVQPFDWRGFFIDRVYKAQERAPLGGIAGGGWRIVYNDTPNLAAELDYDRTNYANMMYSIGLLASSDGTILDINPDLAAGKAGLAPGMAIQRINNEEYSVEEMQRVVAETKDRETTIKVVASFGSRAETFNITYQGGARYPHLVRDLTRTDYLSGITKPLGSPLPAGFSVVNESQTGIFSIGVGSSRKNRNADIVRPFANMTNVVLSQTEIVANCPANSNICSNNKRTIEVSSEAVSSDPTDVLTYNYTVSGGKIVGISENRFMDAKVVWDLTGVRPGTYTITASADNGCGVCGKTVTKEVKVVECSDCK